MAKQTIDREKKVNTSVSITKEMKEFIRTHIDFDFSKFVQLKLREHIDQTKLEEIKHE